MSAELIEEEDGHEVYDPVSALDSQPQSWICRLVGYCLAAFVLDIRIAPLIQPAATGAMVGFRTFEPVAENILCGMLACGRAAQVRGVFPAATKKQFVSICAASQEVALGDYAEVAFDIIEDGKPFINDIFADATEFVQEFLNAQTAIFAEREAAVLHWRNLLTFASLLLHYNEIEARPCMKQGSKARISDG